MKPAVGAVHDALVQPNQAWTEPANPGPDATQKIWTHTLLPGDSVARIVVCLLKRLVFQRVKRVNHDQSMELVQVLWREKLIE